MTRLQRIHPVAGVIGFLTILTFWSSTVFSELFCSTETIIAVKRAIPWGLFLLVPALAITGATGFRLGGASRAPPIASKRRRMPFIAGNGLLILVPSALYLSLLASNENFGATFYAVQALELAAGALNLSLMLLSIRDGLQLKGRLHRA